MKKRFLITIPLMISIVIFCTSCTSLPRNPKDWQTVCIETWDYDSAEKLGGYIKIPPDWEVRTVTGVQSNKKESTSSDYKSVRLEYFISKDNGKIMMIQSDLISSTKYEFTEYKSNMPDVFNTFNNYVIDWSDLNEDEYDHPVDTVFYGKINFDVKGVKYNKFYIDIADKRYIIWDDSVSIETVKSIAESFRDVYMLGWK